MTIREQLEALERETLHPCASLSAESRGREAPAAPCDIRTEYQRDRDRILHCKSFRRLMHKTQVFLSPEGDHYRTRLTHTLEVCQIARTIARALRLNEDLTEAIALGHDLGHTPFGHSGEAVLNDICPHGFRHSEQSVRIVEVLEHDGKGLNLTWEVRDGIRWHSSSSTSLAHTQEGQIVRYADKIAYMNHDIEDAIRAGVLCADDIPSDIRCHLGHTKSQRITALIQAMVDHGASSIGMDALHERLYRELRSFLFQAVYYNPKVKSEESKAQEVVRQLYRYYQTHTQELPLEYRRIAAQTDIPRAVCDYISGMSDRYCIALYEKRFVPRSWSIAL